MDRRARGSRSAVPCCAFPCRLATVKHRRISRRRCLPASLGVATTPGLGPPGIGTFDGGTAVPSRRAACFARPALLIVSRRSRPTGCWCRIQESTLAPTLALPGTARGFRRAIRQMVPNSVGSKRTARGVRRTGLIQHPLPYDRPVRAVQHPKVSRGQQVEAVSANHSR